MTPALGWGISLTMAGSLSAIVVGRRLGRASPRLVSAVELLGLVGIGLLPPVVLSCIAAGLGVSGSSAGPGGLCLLASAGGPRAAQLALYGAAAVLVVRSVFFAARALLGAHRAELRGGALASAHPRVLRGGIIVWVVPSSQIAAYSGGWRHPKALVTTGLLSLLGEAEQAAVCHHEAAHVRLGHPRLLLIGAAVADAYAFLAPAHAAWDRLRRSFEAAADDEAVKALGPRPLLCALAKVALATTRPGTALAFADPEDLRYRIRRLQNPTARSAVSGAALGLAGVALAIALAWMACAALQRGEPLPAIVPCLAGFGLLGLRPTWARRAHGRARSRMGCRGRPEVLTVSPEVGDGGLDAAAAHRPVPPGPGGGRPATSSGEGRA